MDQMGRCLRILNGTDQAQNWSQKAAQRSSGFSFGLLLLQSTFFCGVFFPGTIIPLQAAGTIGGAYTPRMLRNENGQMVNLKKMLQQHQSG
jgi:hypothetical protein